MNSMILILMLYEIFYVCVVKAKASMQDYYVY